MLTVDDYGEIRRAHRDGMSIREIARTLHHSRRKVREALRTAEPSGYRRTQAPVAPKLGPYQPMIDAILAEDAQAPRKQRHTATQIHRRLVSEHGYRGGYDQVRRYVSRKRERERETFIPLVHEAGQRVECDFGQISVDFPDGRRPVSVLLLTWAYSNSTFAIGLPTQRTEAILHGMVAGLEFFGCVPREVWWDNPTTVAVEVLRGRDRRLHERYRALASHYRFEPLFCLPARGNEKPHVENRVKWLQRAWATPVPCVRDLAELNVWLLERCVSDRERTITGRSEPIQVRFDAERAAALPLPEQRFDACLQRTAVVDKYQTVQFDRVSYSVPRSAAYQTVTVKGYVDRVEVVQREQVLACHTRSYVVGEQVLDPLHYLVTLSRKPGCLDHTAVYRDWRLPPCFGELRQALEGRHGSVAGARQYIRVLQLLGAHPLERVGQAIEEALLRGVSSEEVIRLRVEAASLRAGRTEGLESVLPESVPRVDVPAPDLRRFNQFLSGGGVRDVVGEYSGVAVENEPEATAVARDLCGV